MFRVEILVTNHADFFPNVSLLKYLVIREGGAADVLMNNSLFFALHYAACEQYPSYLI